MNRYSFSIFVLLFCAVTPSNAQAELYQNRTSYEDRTVSRSQNAQEQWCYFGAALTNRKLDPDRKDYRPDITSQWNNIKWDDSVWKNAWKKSDGTPLWTRERVLTNMFQGGYFERQYMCGGTPYLRVGTPFLYLSEVDQRRVLQILAEESGVFSAHRRIRLYSSAHKNVIGEYRSSGLTFY